jgi:hypothetical protein
MNLCASSQLTPTIGRLAPFTKAGLLPMTACHCAWDNSGSATEFAEIELADTKTPPESVRRCLNPANPHP